MAVAVRKVKAKELSQNIGGNAYCWSCLKNTNEVNELVQVRVRNYGCKTDFFFCEECAKALLINLEKVVK